MAFHTNENDGLTKKERARLSRFPGFKHGKAVFFSKPFWFSHAPSFLDMVDEIFCKDVYRFHSETKHPFIIDCGANIGLSVFYFYKNYPGAQIWAFEPDKEIFNLLQENVTTRMQEGNISIFEQAVWTTDTQIDFFSEGALAGSAVVDFAGTKKLSSVKAIDLKVLLAREVDFLKIDIEGAENVLIFDIEPQLKFVRHLFLEFHGIKGQQQNLGDILNLLTRAGFSYYIKEAEVAAKPFLENHHPVFNQQLNIYCVRH